MKCGHHQSLSINSAETGAYLYCDLCDAKSRCRDAEAMEAELRAALAAQPAEPVEPVAKIILDTDGECGVEWIGHGDGLIVGAKLYYRAQPAPAAVPLGWKLVPLEPFPSQRIAGAVALMKASDSDLDCTTDEIAAAYRAMIAAAGDKP